MSDYRVVLDPRTGLLDMALENGDIAEDEGLETSVNLSLMLDARAEDEDVLPNPEDRRGSWQDDVMPIPGDKQGSPLWQLSSGLQVPGLAAQYESRAKQALQWYLDDLVAESVDVSAVSGERSLEATIIITRPSGDAVTFRYAPLWEAETGNAI